MRRSLFAVLSFVLCAGCGGDDERATYARTGPFLAGVTTMTINGNTVEVWYPADSGAAAGKPRDTYDLRKWLPTADQGKIPDADAPSYPTDAYRDIAASRARRFPVVLFSHGLAGYRLQSTFLTTHLARWGYIVAAPEHPERGLALLLGGMIPGEDRGAEQLRDALMLLKNEDTRAGGPLEGRVDASKLAMLGHSMGGGTALQAARDMGVSAWAMYASTSSDMTLPTPPALVMGGTGDEITNVGTIETNYDKLPGAGKRFVGIRDAGHLAFADICAIGREQGGILKIAVDHGIDVPVILQQLGSDGCRGEDLPVEEAWPMVTHYTVAHLRVAFGEDPAPGVGLDAAYGESIFGERLFRYRSP